MATGDASSKLTLWATDTGDKVREMACGGRVSSAAFSPDGSLVAREGNGAIATGTNNECTQMRLLI